MQWIHNYQLFLFDLDGLLVDTESLHYLAYKNMLQARNFVLPWDFHRYCMTAHYHADKIADELLELFPTLYQSGETWEQLYAAKKQAMVDLLKSGHVNLMPGVFELLTSLQKANIKRCVVTHSPDSLVELLRQQHPILTSIPFWITRQVYNHPKPHSECYLKAIDEHAHASDRIIGFEDSPRGLTALMGTRAQPVLICQVSYPEIGDFISRGAQHFPTLNAIDQL
jgi:HAD superfamily hydrolase (TIGR01509 family)